MSKDLTDIPALARGRHPQIERVRLLGHKAPVQFAQEESGLKVATPLQKPCEHAFALEIAGTESSSNAKP